jgi:hypothetical protein
MVRSSVGEVVGEVLQVITFDGVIQVIFDALCCTDHSPIHRLVKVVRKVVIHAIALSDVVHHATDDDDMAGRARII